MARGSASGAEGPGRESWSCISVGLGPWAFTPPGSSVSSYEKRDNHRAYPKGWF